MEIDLKHERLRELDKSAGGLTPEAVVTDASDPSSPLHDCFTWDDSEAARQWRRFEARKLIARYEIVVADVSDERVREWEYVPSLKRFVATVAIHASPVLRDEVLSQMKRDWELFRDRYRAFLKMPQHLVVRDRIDEVGALLDEAPPTV